MTTDSAPSLPPFTLKYGPPWVPPESQCQLLSPPYSSLPWNQLTSPLLLLLPKHPWSVSPFSPLPRDPYSSLSIHRLHACRHAQSLQVWLFAPLWTVACHVPLSMEFSRQEYWSGLPCPLSGDLPDSGIKPASPVSPALQADSPPLSHRGIHLLVSLKSISQIAARKKYKIEHALPLFKNCKWLYFMYRINSNLLTRAS